MNSQTFQTTRKTLATLMVVAAGLLHSGAICSAATEVSPAVQIRLWPAASVHQTQVRLAQIATVRGDETLAAPLRSLVVADGLVAGRKFPIRAYQVAEQIAGAGFDVTKVSIRGAAVCGIDCLADPQAKPAEAAADTDSGFAGSGPASLESHLRRIITKTIQSKNLPRESKIKIAFNPTLNQVLSLTDPPYRFDISAPRTTPGLGLMSFKVKILRDAAVLQTLPVMAEVTVRCPVIVASKPINSKARITKSDLEVNWRELNFFNTKILTRIDDAVDQQAKKMIHPGTVLTSELLESLPMVKRGQLVTVLYHRGGLDIRIVGKAMQNAFKNEIIPVRNERSKEIFRARVTGEGQVSVENTPAGGASEPVGQSDTQ